MPVSCAGAVATGLAAEERACPSSGAGGAAAPRLGAADQQCHLQLPRQALLHQGHLCVLLHVPALNSALSVPPGLAWVPVCSWERARGWGRGGDAVGHGSHSCSAPGPRTTSLLRWKGEGTVPRIRGKLGACARVNEFSHSSLEGAQQNQGFTRGNQVFHSYTFTIFQHIPSNKMAINKTTLPASSFGWC